ncbi:hypothetical protein LP417_26410 [Polaromonas sp. P1-6]|nr:hypothetical protein LP417_26410 [Polaromonas sp. P1-6]
MGRQTIWGGLGKPPSRDVMQAAAKAARSEMMTRIRDNKVAQPARGGERSANGGGGNGGGRGRGPAGGGNGGGNGGAGRGRGPAQPRQNAGYPQGGQPSGQPRHAQAPRQRDEQPRAPRQDSRSEPRNDFDNQQPASHASSGFPSSGQPTGNRNNFRGGRSGGGGGSGGAGGRSNGPRRSGGPGSFTGR